MISRDHRLDSHDHDSLLLAIDPEKDCPTVEEIRLVCSTDPFDVEPTETCDSTRTASPSRGTTPSEYPSDTAPNDPNDPNDAKALSPTREEKNHARLARNRETAKLSRERKRAHHQSMLEELRVSRWQIRDLQCRCLYLENENYRMHLALTGGTVETAVPYPSPPPTLVRSTHQPHPAAPSRTHQPA